ncbi:MAG TPA: hypothetical protein VNL13_02945 [Sulfolobales archaeon]|nr:hypothetical protein [Sulfolobales archaeon]
MGERAGEASRSSLEDLAIAVEDRVGREIRRKLGKKAQYVVAIKVTRSGDGGIDLGIDLQVFSPAPLDDKKFFRIVDEVIDAGFDEAEERIKRSREGAVGSLEGKKSSSSVAPISGS